MAITNLVGEVTSCPGAPDGLALVEAIVGDTVSLTPFFVVPAAGAAPVITLVRKPSGSAAAIASGNLAFDVAGLFDVTIANCGLSRALTFATFPVSALSVSGSSRPAIRRLINGNPLVTRATMITALEAASPLFVGGLNAALFGQPIGPASYPIPFT